jgi:hypothetical protein
MSTYDERNDYQTDCATEDRWFAIDIMRKSEKIIELEKRGILTEDETDVPAVDFRYTDDELTEMLYDTDFNPFS